MYYTVGMLAHVDAGKTTFCEQLLYRTHAIRTLGRVDHADAFMDFDPMERRRGITIFSSQAAIEIGGDTLQLLDTPGHADFSAEMERSVSVLDAAVLLLSGVEGIQSHTRTVWKILERYNIPVFLFINKTDRAGADADGLIRKLREIFSDDIVDMRAWPADDAFVEAVAERDEQLLDRYMGGEYDRDEWLTAFSEQFAQRRIYPVLAGAALQGVGVGESMELFWTLLNRSKQANGENPFSAKVYKIRNDEKNGRLACMKVLSGTIAPRETIENTDEKITALYRIQGTKLIPIDRAEKGMLCAAVGLSVRAGETMGHHRETDEKMLEPMLLTSVRSLDGASPSKLLGALRVLEDEDPLLQIEWQEKTSTAAVRIMGTVQLETLQEMMESRFGLKVEFGPCRVRYFETITEESVGIGHYEPLRHYAEVRVLLQPAPRGSGILFESKCHVDFLGMHWQNLIREMLLKRRHKGVLTGSDLTDVRIVLINGRAHLKHTEGGDFYEASGRAVRQALMHAKSILLEPLCRFQVSAPGNRYDVIAREMIRMQADTELSERNETECLFTGTVAASVFIRFLNDLPALTHGQGSASWEAIGYIECRNAAEIIEKENYDPLADQENTPHSVFCQKGAGFVVHWDHAEEWAHTGMSANYEN